MKILSERAVEILVEAALAGVPQAYGEREHGPARCVVGLLMERATGNVNSTDYISFGLGVFPKHACPVGSCRAPFDLWSDVGLLMHLNDVHKWDFLTLARKLG